jgi:hypothetical protein
MTRAGTFFNRSGAQMKSTRMLLVVIAATLSGCVTAGPQFQPADIASDVVYTNPVEVGTFGSPAELERVLPLALARHGYAIAKVDQSANGHIQVVTEWLSGGAPDLELVPGAQARTRLVLEVRPRGPRYALLIYSITYLRDANGAWQKQASVDQSRGELRELGRQLAIQIR